MNAPSAESLDLARMARQHFLQSLCLAIPSLDKLILEQLGKTENVGFAKPISAEADPAREPANWRALYIQHRAQWAQLLVKRWRQAFSAASKKANAVQTLDSVSGIEELSLMDDQVIENLIAASRLTAKIADQISPQFTELRKRLRGLEICSLPDNDTIRPSVLMDDLLSCWVSTGMHKDAFTWAVDGVLDAWLQLLQIAYDKANAFLEEKAVTPEAGDLVIKNARNKARFTTSEAAAYLSTSAGAFGARNTGDSLPVAPPHALLNADLHRPSNAGLNPINAGQDAFMPLQASAVAALPKVDANVPILEVSPSSYGQKALTQFSAVVNDVRNRLSHVMAGAYAASNGSYSNRNGQTTEHFEISPQLQNGLTQYSGFFQQTVSAQNIARLARLQSEAIQKNAQAPTEKAIIEMVALMFQSVLAEERVPSTVRILFARLQVPALRVALADPQFFQDMNHPVRRLIDRMGSSVMGFDGAAFEGSDLENELRRIVHMIEQYPDAGIKVFQLALNEFEKFLQKYLSENRMNSKVTSVAQQIEEKETLLVKFTIELRKLLNELSIKEEVKDFLFKIWAEVLAVSALRHGAKSPETQSLKRTASLLVWITAAKTHPKDRSRAAQALPKLLQQVAKGLQIIGVDSSVQEATNAQIVALVNDAFLSKTQPISDHSLKLMSHKLDSLEVLAGSEGLDDMELSAQNIELILGVEASNLKVFAQPNLAAIPADLLTWVMSRELGTWFRFTSQEPQGITALSDTHVQYIWHSQQKQLHLFASNEGESYLFTLKTWAAYFQSGKLLPLDQEGLMLRATRVALTQYQNLPSMPVNAAP